VRGGIRIATVPKMMATGQAQWQILKALDFEDADRYYVALLKVFEARAMPCPTHGERWQKKTEPLQGSVTFAEGDLCKIKTDGGTVLTVAIATLADHWEREAPPPPG
jgi:hypothetical protein